MPQGPTRKSGRVSEIKGRDPLRRFVPRLMVFTDRHASARPLARTVQSVLDAGARCVVLTELDLPEDERARVADDLWPMVASRGGTLLIAGRMRRAAGNHLMAGERLGPRRRGAILGRDCPDERAVHQAVRERADYVTVGITSPILGGGGIRLLSRCAAIEHAPPIFVTGAPAAHRVPEYIQLGAYGVAVRRAVMEAPDPGHVVRALQREFDRCTQAETA